MHFGKEFRDYAVKHRGMGGIHVDKHIEGVVQGIHPMAFTPTEIEERPLNATPLMCSLD